MHVRHSPREAPQAPDPCSWPWSGGGRPTVARPRWPSASAFPQLASGGPVLTLLLCCALHPACTQARTSALSDCHAPVMTYCEIRKRCGQSLLHLTNNFFSESWPWTCSLADFPKCAQAGLARSPAARLSSGPDVGPTFDALPATWQILPYLLLQVWQRVAHRSGNLKLEVRPLI